MRGHLADLQRKGVPKVKRYLLIFTMVLLVATGQQAWSGETGTHQFASDASKAIFPFLVVGELSLLTDGDTAKPEMLQGAKTMVATTLFTQILKRAVSEKRPNSSAHTSFPSGHTSAAFAMATVVGDYKPNYKWLAYGVASTIGWSRVELHTHRWRDVIGGAALGYFTAKHFTNQHLEATPDGVRYNWKW
jgi:membrane-associated phospholipid phosphatase